MKIDWIPVIDSIEQKKQNYRREYLKRAIVFLADRTNGRAYATVLRLSVCRLWRYVLWLNGAS